MPSAVPKYTTVTNRLLVLLGVLIFLLTLTQVQLPNRMRDERRHLNGLPSVHWTDLWSGAYFHHLDDAINDHFFGRPLLVYLKNEQDLKLFGRVRKDLVGGKEGYIFYRAILENYYPDRVTVPYERWRRVLSRLSHLAKAQNKTLVFQTFRNKEFIYNDRLPETWTSQPQILPLMEVMSDARGLGVATLEYDDLMARQKRAGMMVYTPFEENHPSPEFFFAVMQRLLPELGKLAAVSVFPPREFPSIRSSTIKSGDYRAAHYINSNYPSPAPWAKTLASEGGEIHEYQNPKGVLPPTIIYTDSFLNVLCQEFGYAFLPNFTKLTLHYSNYSIEGWQGVKLVLLSFADQNAVAAVGSLETLAERLEK